MTIPNPEHLLDQADALLVRTRRGPHRQSDLRRAISTAYYAVFHVVLAAAADRIVGRSQRSAPQYTLVYRSIDHRSLSSICHVIAQSVLPQKYRNFAPIGGFGDEMRIFADAVTELQQERLAADYDPGRRIAVSRAELLLVIARESIRKWTTLTVDQRDAFLILLMFSPR